MDSSRNNSEILQQNVTTYKRAFQSYNPQRTHSSLDRPSNRKPQDAVHNNDEDNYPEEQIDTIQLEDDRPRAQSASHIKNNKFSREKPPSSHKQQHRTETMHFHDDGENVVQPNDLDEQSQQQQKEIPSLSDPVKPSTTQDGTTSDNKSRKIRRLQKKLSLQEEETKKKFDELQSKQSRLENALKLLMKQTTTFKKRREPNNETVEGKQSLSFVISIHSNTKRCRCTGRQCYHSITP